MTPEEIEALEARKTNEELELDLELDGTEDVEAIRVKLSEAEDAKRQITARAHKAEAELRALRARTVEAPPLNNSEEALDARILKSQGMADDLLAELRIVAQVRKVSILEAQNDPIFLAIKAKKESEDKSSNASVGVSRGSGSAKTAKTMNTAGLSDEDHKAMWLSQR